MISERVLKACRRAAPCTSVVLAALAVGCGTPHARATSGCRNVDSEILGQEVMFQGSARCQSCCRDHGADRGSFYNDECHCYGGQPDEQDAEE